ncbi:unnamed protein product [Clonostachys rosea f. rosea IK726]|uniref:Uncharacterized protein n=1 Tax=Clonostachys rosea f. rosea IK726 TaxID=1349383 RepID=A0ACA9TGR3_BIOOC|nr:unnamed protein product [Clonostachys rosea f. rosea IK726]
MSPEWKTSLSATERQSDLGLSMGDAISLEQNAYAVSITRDDYSTRCRAPPSTLIPQHDAKNEAREDDDEVPDTGIHIGTYRNCVPVSDGITSEVYRSGSTALKVIVNFHQDIEPHNPQRESRILDLLRDKPSIIQLLDVFRDQEQRLVLAFPFMPLTLGDLLDSNHHHRPSKPQIKHIFHDVLRGLHIFKTLGTPTPETWPEAKDFKISPFEMWNVFPARSWEGDILPDVDPGFRELVAGMVRYDGKRTTAEEALKYIEQLELQPE